MKKFMYVAMLLCAGFAVTSCESDEEDNTATITFEGEQWSSLIDPVQYYGDVLYGANASSYAWTEHTTTLTGGMSNTWGGMYGFSEGGTVISNYICDSIAEHNDYAYQLEVPTSNGSSQFAVVYCPATLQFKDGEAHEIKSMDICPTTFLLAVEMYGNAYAKALTNEGDYFTLAITADNGQSVSVDLARDGQLQKSWKRINLTSLGMVKSISFSMTGSDSSDWGVNTPTYFALDNISVVL